jgi:hypothetical protein
MCNLTQMETELKALDKSDAAGGSDTNYRLRNRWHEEGRDTTKRELERDMEKELIEYGMFYCSPLIYQGQHKKLTNYVLVTLLEKFSYVKSLSHTPPRDHDSVFKWMWSNQPLDPGEDDWIFHADDFVSIVPPRRNRFESFILSHLDGGPNSWFKVRSPLPFKLRPFNSPLSSYPPKDRKWKLH